MPIPESVFESFPGDNPSGAPLRGSELYAQIEEARRQDDDLPKGVWKESREPKRANFGKVAQLCIDGLSTKSKDLQLAAWLCEALLHQRAFGGLRDGLDVCRRLLESFWDTVYPELDEDGDPGRRVGVLNWIGARLGSDCRMTPLTAEGYGLAEYEQARRLPGDKATDADAKQARDKAIKEKKLLPEVFDRAFQKTPKAFYAQLVEDVTGSIAALDGLSELCQSRFAEDVSFGELRLALRGISDQALVFLDRKREIEPDSEPEVPSQPEAAPGATTQAAGSSAGRGTAVATAPAREIVITAAEPAGRLEAIAAVVAAAEYLRKHEPFSPAPYLMLRGLRWGELRAAVAAGDYGAFDAPPTEVRTRIKRLALARQWTDVLDATEQAMALPAGRAWLDLQRAVVEACRALGPEYAPIAGAVSSATAALVADLPQLLDATLLDDSPAANPETRAWILSLRSAAAGDAGPREWKRVGDVSELAADAFQAGDQTKAFDILQRELERQQSGRERFRLKLEMVELCMKAGKENIAQPLLEDVAAAVETHKLDDWEDREFVATALVALMQHNKRIQGDAKEKQKLFERICRLHPVKALSC